MRIDFHVHSKFSKRPSQWFLQKLGCPESFTEPLQIYKIAKSKGMSLVTISDHNTIAGALEIAHLSDAFVSEEVTTYFPEDGCKLHVLTVDITEAQHDDIQKARKNLFELIDYLNSEQIFYAVAHCLYDINDRLTVDHFEQALLLFKNFEINGTRDGRLNDCLKRILNGLAADDIDRLVEKHGIPPAFPEPWIKNIIGGSDDHSALHIAETHTRVPGASCPKSAIREIENGKAKVVSRPSTPQTLAHNLYGIAYQFFRNKLDLNRFGGKDMLINFLDRSLTSDTVVESGFMSKLINIWQFRRRRKPHPKIPRTLLELLCHETRQLIIDNPNFLSTRTKESKPNDTEVLWFDVVNQVSNKVLYHFADHLMDHISGANVFNIFQSIGSAGGLYTLLAPYFLSFSYFSRDHRFGQKVEERFLKAHAPSNAASEPLKIAHFTDTYYDVNGVALSLQQQVQVAIRNNKRLTVITCDTENRTKKKGIQNFNPIGVYQLPEYPELKMFYPLCLKCLTTATNRISRKSIRQPPARSAWQPWPLPVY